MLTGLPPYYTRDREKLFDRIRRGELIYPKDMGDTAKNLCEGLLKRDPNERIGGKSDGVVNCFFFFVVVKVKVYELDILQLKN